MQLVALTYLLGEFLELLLDLLLLEPVGLWASSDELLLHLEVGSSLCWLDIRYDRRLVPRRGLKRLVYLSEFI